jgi:hypothetical protein
MKKVIGYVGLSAVVLSMNIAPMSLRFGLAFGALLGISALVVECAGAALIMLFVKWICDWSVQTVNGNHQTIGTGFDLTARW